MSECDHETSTVRRLGPIRAVEPREKSVIPVFNEFRDENCAFLGSYAANGCNFLPAFRVNQSVPSSRNFGKKLPLLAP